MSTNNLKRLKDQSALKLDNYNTAVEGGRGLTADDLRHEVTNKRQQ